MAPEQHLNLQLSGVYHLCSSTRSTDTVGLFQCRLKHLSQI